MTIPEFPLLIVAARMNFLANGPLKLIIILTVFGWVGVARLIRGNVISLREEEYVEAAKAIGASGWRVITRHLLPNTTATIIVWATLRVGLVIVTEATLSYFGLGIQPPLASWGNMLQGSQTYIWSAQWLVWWPGLCILLTTLFLNFIGDGLRDAMDPKLVL
jgi:peptide/nickel transport system permease protein